MSPVNYYFGANYKWLHPKYKTNNYKIDNFFYKIIHYYNLVLQRYINKLYTCFYTSEEKNNGSEHGFYRDTQQL